jgi:hypothetical protein
MIFKPPTPYIEDFFTIRLCGKGIIFNYCASYYKFIVKTNLDSMIDLLGDVNDSKMLHKSSLYNHV